MGFRTTQYSLLKLHATAAAMLLIVGFASCQRSQQPSPAEKVGASDAQEILVRMADAYRQAKSYADSGDLYVRAKLAGVEQVDPPIPYSTTVERPSRLRLHWFDATVMADGKTLWAIAQNAPGQILQQAGPAALSASVLPNDVMLQEALTRNLPLVKPWPLIFMTNADPVASLLAGAEPPQLLEGISLADRPCHRISVKRPDSEQILWIDRETLVLRRVDYSGNALKSVLDPDNQLTDLEVWAEFKGAQFEPTLSEETFAFEVPAGARLVKRLITPAPEPPAALGQNVGEFSLPTQAEPLNRGQLVDKVTVLCFWSATHDPCRAVLPNLELLWTKYRGNSRVQFFAVNVDPSVIAPEKLRTTLRSWGSTLPIVRDMAGSARGAMFVEQVPTVVVVGGDARIHDIQAGENFDPSAVDRAVNGLLADDDVARHLLEQYDEQRRRYQLELEQVAADGVAAKVDVPLPTIRARTEPSHLKLEKLWTVEKIKQPGNILIVDQGEQDSRAIVFDGWRTLVELEPDGEVRGTYPLAIPEGTIASYLRTATSADGKRWFAASSVNQQQVFLLDEQFQVQWSYPADRNPGIADVQFADLSGKGDLQLIVGYWGAAGVQAVSLAGERVWGNRTLENVIKILISAPRESGERQALCYSTRGTLLPLDSRGEAGTEILIPGRTLSSLAAEDVNGDGTIEICALAVDPRNLGEVTAIGLSSKGEELWSYALPPGSHEYIVERIVPARLAKNDGGWLLPAADGSIHLLTATGELVDRFNYGAALTGLGLTRWNGKPVLLVSTPEGCTAWKISPPEGQ